jgi:hypothetical protein
MGAFLKSSMVMDNGTNDSDDAEKGGKSRNVKRFFWVPYLGQKMRLGLVVAGRGLGFKWSTKFTR